MKCMNVTHIKNINNLIKPKIKTPNFATNVNNLWVIK